MQKKKKSKCDKNVTEKQRGSQIDNVSTIWQKHYKLFKKLTEMCQKNKLKSDTNNKVAKKVTKYWQTTNLRVLGP